MEKFSNLRRYPKIYIVKALGTGKPKSTPVPKGGGKPGLQLLPSKKNPNVKRWEQTQQKQTGQNGQNVQTDIRVPGKKEPYWGKHSGAQVGHRIKYHGNHISITGVGEHGVTARDEHGRKYEIFHHELRKRGGNNGK